MSTTLKRERWGPPWLITTGMPSVRHCIKASKEKTGERCIEKNTTTPRVKRISKEETKQDQHFEKHLKNPIVALGKALKCVKNRVLEVSARVLWGRCFLQWLLLASSEVWEKPMWKGVWPHLDPMDRVQKEPATMQGSETFTPFFKADIRPLPRLLPSSFSLLMSLRSARLSPCTRWRKEEEMGMDFKSPSLGKNGTWAA